MAQGDMFLKMEGVQGESKDKKLSLTMEISGYSWGAMNSGTFHTATGGGQGRVVVGDLKIHKMVDAATPNLAVFCVTGKHVTNAELTVRRAGGSAAANHISIKLEKCLVSSYTLTGSGEGQSERFVLNFAKIKMEVYKQTDTGGETSAGIMTYDVPAHDAS
jgi:type VI secretion system secreted protein Hcp